MKIAIAFYSKTGSTEKVALTIKSQLEGQGHAVKVFQIEPVKDLKAYQYKKDGKSVELKGPLPDLKKFDLALVGTPVWGFCPTPIILSFLRSLKGVSGKRFALFATCTALPGTTIQRMSNILTTKGAKICGSLTIRSIFALDESKLGEAKKFAETLSKL